MQSAESLTVLALRVSKTCTTSVALRPQINLFAKPVVAGSADMKNFKEFISESVNIAGDFTGNLYMNGQPEQEQANEENFYADVVWEGKIYRLQFATEHKGLPSREELAEHIQNEYPGGIVHNIYPVIEANKNYRVKSVERYQPEALTWKTEL